MMISIETAPPFSLVFVMDPVSGELPHTLGPGPVTVGESSVAVGTMAESDGPTRLFLGDGELPPVDGLELRWEGWLVTSGRIAFVSAEDEVLIERRAGGCVHLEVWSNDESEPDAVCVLITEPMEDAQGEPVP